ncbi:MAG: ATP synthase F1 subunit delta [Ruminococcus sp.]|nr:ATP synthase F1 subunit delta [Ruminococcus sp.]
MATSVDKVYSAALMSIAREDKSAKKLDRELNTLSGIIADNPELTAVLCAPTVTGKEKLTLIEKIFKGKVSGTVYNFLCVLVSKNRFGSLCGICEEFRKEYYEEYGIREVTVTTVIPLKDKAKEKLMAKLRKMYGKEIILIEKTDPSILGGMIVTCGGSMLDGSVKTELDNMHRQIKDMVAG